MGIERHVVHPDRVTRESGLWSHASSVRLPGARLIFIAGQTARRQDGTALPGDDFDAQFRLVYENLEAVLAASGARFADVVSLRTFLRRAGDIERFWALRDEAHRQRFPGGNYPPNTLVVVDRMAHPEMLVEIEAVAVVEA